MRTILILLLIASSIYAAHAIGLGREGRGFGRLGAMNKGVAAAPPAGCAFNLNFSNSCNSQYVTIIH